jgi:hypothetical protein
MLNTKALLLAKLKTYSPKTQAVLLGGAKAIQTQRAKAAKPKDPAST